MRHGKGDTAGQTGGIAAGGDETYLHERMKHWVRDTLRDAGMVDADEEQTVGDRRPDVYGHYNGQAFAVEVQWSDLDEDHARARTDGLLAAGVGQVLWLTRPCLWVPRLPAVGIRDFNPTGPDYDIFTGAFSYWPSGMRVQQYSLRAFLRQWVAADIDWAWIDLTKAGWATMTDWQQHTERQAREIARLEDRLERTRGYLGDLQGKLGDAETKHAESAADVKRLEQQLDDLQRAHERELAEARDGAEEQLDNARTLATRAAEGYRGQQAELEAARESIGTLRTAVLVLAIAAAILVAYIWAF
ncbi:MAG: hypothetical protein HOQ24_08600 [Mycobacteriaceae bacterium]|nr:hypothetical protein [Mycobacteriaceae bacterium]